MEAAYQYPAQVMRHGKHSIVIACYFCFYVTIDDDDDDESKRKASKSKILLKPTRLPGFNFPRSLSLAV